MRSASLWPQGPFPRVAPSRSPWRARRDSTAQMPETGYRSRGRHRPRGRGRVIGVRARPSGSQVTATNRRGGGTPMPKRTRRSSDRTIAPSSRHSVGLARLMRDGPPRGRRSLALPAQTMRPVGRCHIKAQPSRPVRRPRRRPSTASVQDDMGRALLGDAAGRGARPPAPRGPSRRGRRRHRLRELLQLPPPPWRARLADNRGAIRRHPVPRSRLRARRVARCRRAPFSPSCSRHESHLARGRSLSPFDTGTGARRVGARTGDTRLGEGRPPGPTGPRSRRLRDGRGDRARRTGRGPPHRTAATGRLVP
jgi:hypothetical protein